MGKERFLFKVWDIDDDAEVAELRARLTSELQDFAATSGLGRGEARVVLHKYPGRVRTLSVGSSMLERMFEQSLREWAERARDQALPADPAAMIDEIRECERLKCVLEGRQARLAAALPDNRGTAHQVALARRESPHRGRQHLGLARILTREMPATCSALVAGHLTEHRATLLARETGCLSREDRAAVDRQVAGDPERLEGLGDRQLVAEARTLAYELDPASFVTRRRQAEADRCVTLRPAPDCMAYVTALLPVAQGVAVWATLRRLADSARAAGDPRGRGQVMADSLVAAVLGHTGSTQAPPVPVAVNLLVSDAVLLGTAEEAAHLDGFGPIPAELAREMAADPKAKKTLRRVYANPQGRIVAMDSHTRCFTGNLAKLIKLRDRTCRTPWCNAPIRHLDHRQRRADHGPTSAANADGLCEACNYAKETPGWQVTPGPDPEIRVVTTPTGHTYRSRAPNPGHAA